MQLVRVEAGSIILNSDVPATGIAADAVFTIEFSSAADTASLHSGITLKNDAGTITACHYSFSADLSSATLDPVSTLDYLTNYTLDVSSGIKGINGESFPGVKYKLTTIGGKLTLVNVSLNGIPFKNSKPLANIDLNQVTLVAEFSAPLSNSGYQSYFTLSGGAQMTATLSSDSKSVTLSNSQPLKGYSRYSYNISSNLTSLAGYSFDGFFNSFFTCMDSTDKYPRISDEELLDKVQQQTFRYFWDFGHPSCGMARERNSSGDIVTTGGSGFGIMAMVAGMERGFITRAEGLSRLDKILHFLETCDRFHGAWPHWLNGATGKTIPFSQKDDGADLVETSFMIQGLLAMREYLDPSSATEGALAGRITGLWESVEWTWFQNGKDVLYWHWSPKNLFIMNMQLRGYNETLISYILAASSPTYPIPASAYHNGYASNGAIRNGKKYFGITLPLGGDFGGPPVFYSL